MDAKPKIAILTWHRIYPVGSGHALRVVNIAKMLARDFEVTVVAINHKRDPHFKDMDRALDSFRIVQKDFSPAYPGVFYAVSCLASSYPAFYPRPVLKYLLEITEDARIVQIETLRLFRLARKIGKPLVLDEHNIEWERVSYKSGFLKGLLSRIWKITAARFERKAIKAADLVLVTSERDRGMILEAMRKTDREKITVIPNCIDMADYQDPEPAAGPVRPVSTRRPLALFMGSLDYFPNRDAVDIILGQIAPKAPEIDFLIVGRGLDPGKLVLSENVEYAGYVDDIRRPIADSDVCICPLRHGSGTRLKILEYMVMGKPVISTTKGAEGLGVEDGVHLCLEDDLPAFASRIRDLLGNPDLYRTLQTNGRAFVTERYDWRAHSAVIAGKLARLV